ncbi:MAG: biotin transporter BioY [Eubacteriaceae bacterium]
MNQSKIRIQDMTTMALFATLTAIFSQISIPLPMTPVPINLALLSVFVSGGILSPYKAGISQIIYVLLGVIGLPVFANFGGGLGTLLGPTGGYVLGYILCAFIISFILRRTEKNYLSLFFSIIIGLLICYLLGTFWFTISTNTSFISALSLCVFPFIPGDLLKILISIFLISRLKKIEFIKKIH